MKAMTNKVSVVIVTSAPAIGKPEMLTGIRTKEAAAEWGVKRGYSTVYFWPGRERVYADKLTKAVDALARQIETKSDHLVQMAEQGSALVEAAILFVLVALIVYGLGSLLGWPF